GLTRPSGDRLEKSLFALRLDLATRSGMADEWAGVPAGAPNPLRDLTHLFMCAEMWRLFDKPAQTTGAGPAAAETTLALRMAKQLRHHPRLTPLWNCLDRLPGFPAAKSAARSFLRRAA